VKKHVSIEEKVELSVQIKTQCVTWMIEMKSPTKVQRKFRSVFGRNKDAPSIRTLKRWQEKFQRSGSCRPAKRSRSNPLDSDRTLQCFQETLRQSIRRVANQCQVNYSSVRRCLKCAKYRAYKPQVVQALLPQDLIARMNFATKVLEKISDDPQFLKLVMFSGEAIFHLEGGVNKQNMRHWSKKNPAWIIESSLNSPKVMVWAAMAYPAIIGPFFFEENVNGDSYLEMLQQNFMPELNLLRNSSDIIFMQDGAPPHWAKKVRSWLNETFPGRWIGTGGPKDLNIAWPPRSPDMTPLDFFYGGTSRVKSTPGTTRI